MASVGRRILCLIFLCELHGVRFILGLSEFIWAITLFLPGDTFRRPIYAVMASFMAEELWALIFTAMGLLQWYIIYQQNYHSKLSIAFAACNSVFWWFIVISMVLSVSPFPAAISGEIGLAVGAAWVFIRSGMPKVDRHKFDRRKPNDT